MGIRIHFGSLSVTAALVFSFPGPDRSFGEEVKSSACMECHSEKMLTRTNAAGKEVSCFVDLAKLAASVHRTNSCASCHSDITLKHPDDNLPAKPIDCRVCHQKQSEIYGMSVDGI